MLYVDGKPLADPPFSKYTDSLSMPGDRTARDNFGPYRVPADSFFMMGDNRDNSHDSRFMGPIPKELIKGKAMIIYWSWDSARRGAVYRNLASLPRVVAEFIWGFPSRVRYGRLGDVIF